MLTLILSILVVGVFVRTDFFQEALKDRVVSAVQGSLKANIEYEEATVEVFRLSPRIIFSNVALFDEQTGVDVEIKNISISISIFVSLPLLLFKEILIEKAKIDGLQYHLHDLNILDQWLSRIRPEGSKIETAFKTRVNEIEFTDFDLSVDLPATSRLKRPLSGQFNLDRFEVELDGEDFWLNGQFRFTDFQSGGFQLESGRLEIEDVLYTKSFARFDRIFLESGEDYLELSGLVENWDSPLLDVNLRSSFRLEDYSKNSPASGRVKIVATAEGKVQSLKGVLDLQSSDLQVRGRKFDEVSLRSEFQYPVMDVKSLEIKSQDERIRGAGSLNVKTFEVGGFSLNLQRVDLGQALRMINSDRKTWTGKIDGNIRLGGSLENESSVNGEANLKVENFGVFNKEGDFIYGAPPSEVQLNLELNSLKTGGFDVVMNNNGGDWTGGAAWSPGQFRIFWDGNLNGGKQGDLFQFEIEMLGRVKGSYGGPLDRMVIDMDLDAPQFELDDHLFTNLRGKLRFVDRVLFADPLEFDSGKFTGGLYFPKEDNTEFRDFNFEFSQQNLQTVFSSLDQVRDWPMQPIGGASGSGVLNGWIQRPAGTGVLIGHDIRFERDRTRGRLLKANWKFDEGVFYMDKVFVQTSSASGGINGKVSFIIRGVKDFDLQGREIRITDWLPLTGLEIPIQSLVDFTMSYRRAEDKFLGDFNLYESRLGGQAQENSDVKIEINSNRAKVDGDLFGGRLKARVDERFRSSLESTVSFKSFDLIDYFNEISDSGLEYLLNGDGLCRINFDEDFSQLKAYEKFFAPIAQYQCDLAFRRGKLTRARQTLHDIDSYDLSVVAVGPELVSRYRVKNLLLRSEGGAKLSIEGEYASPSDLSLQISGTTSLTSAAYAMPAISRAEGKLDINGTWNRSGFTGSLGLKNGGINFEDSPISVRQVSAELIATQSQFELSNFSGQFRDGNVSGRGQFSLKGFDVDTARINLQLNGPLIEPDRGIRFQASGPLTISVGAESSITGEIQVFNATYRKRMNLRSDLMDFFKEDSTKRFNFFTEEEGYFDDWNLNVGLTTSEPVTIRNNLAEGALDLRLRITGRVKEPRLVGSIQILNGTFNYFNREFQVQSGSVQFSNPNSNIPRYEIRAEAEIDVYRVFINLIGDSTEQRILYSSDPPLQEKEILALVSYGTPPEDQDNIRVDDATSSAAFTGISFFTGQLQDTIEGALSTDLGIQRFQLLPAFFEETGRTELQLKIGTDLVRNRLELNYYNFVSADGGHQVELDLRINRNLSLVSSWRDSVEDGEEELSGDLGSDIIFRFEVE